MFALKKFPCLGVTSQRLQLCCWASEAPLKSNAVKHQEWGEKTVPFVRTRGGVTVHFHNVSTPNPASKKKGLCQVGPLRRRHRISQPVLPDDRRPLGHFGSNRPTVPIQKSPNDPNFFALAGAFPTHFAHFLTLTFKSAANK